jgi:hypothetical protein
MLRASRITFALALTLLAAGGASAATIGYWRMEVDNNPSAGGLSVPNEVAGGSALLSSEAALDGVNLPGSTVPLTGLQNDFSVAATIQGSTNGINASAAWYAALDVSSISIEFYARTVEATATPFRFSSGGLDGIVMANPNSLDVTYHVSNGGTPTAYSLQNVADMNATWSHYAFVYDETTGIASFYVDGVLVSSFDGPDASPLYLVPGTPVQVGVLMDYAQAGQGTMDEVRIDGSVLTPPIFLVPEPGSGALLGFGLCGLAARRRHSGTRRA